MAQWRTIGVIGGMGPAATADFMARLVTAAGAARDEDHPHVLVDSNPHVPDRNAALAGTGPSPGPVLAQMAANLLSQGAQILAMPCNAAHGWAGAVVDVAGTKFIDIIDTALASAMEHAPRRIGILAIGATLDAKLYDRGPVPIIAGDRSTVQALVNRVKAGERGTEIEAAMAAIANDLVAGGADVIIAACTEVPIVLDAAAIGVPFIDATQTLAVATLTAARLD